MTEQQTEQTETRKVPTEVYSRTVGYLRPTRNWHQAKRLEFQQRKTYKVGKSLARFEPETEHA